MTKRMIPFVAFLAFCCAGQSGKDKFLKIYFPDGSAVTAELAVSDDERQQGLMFREGIQENQGMLFVFEEEDIHAFWMKNMRFAIDILWLDRDKRIVHIEENVPPCAQDPCPSYPPSAPAKYVLELMSGMAQKHGLRPSDRFEFILPRSLSGLQSP